MRQFCGVPEPVLGKWATPTYPIPVSKYKFSATHDERPPTQSRPARLNIQRTRVVPNYSIIWNVGKKRREEKAAFGEKRSIWPYEKRESPFSHGRVVLPVGTTEGGAHPTKRCPPHGGHPRRGHGENTVSCEWRPQVHARVEAFLRQCAFASRH